MEPELNKYERKVLLKLCQLGEKVPVEKLAESLHLDQATVARACFALQTLELVKIDEDKIQKIELTEEGARYAEMGLPERRILKTIVEVPRMSLREASSAASLAPEEIQIALAWLRRRGWAEFKRQDGEIVLEPTEEGKRATAIKTDEEEILEAVREKPLDVASLRQELRSSVDILQKRGLVRVLEKKIRWVSITEKGRARAREGLEEVEEITELTKEDIVTGRWRRARLKRYDVAIPGPAIYPAKIHPQQAIIDELREILLEMGFVEIKSRIVESEFWNFDALFQAQDHPAREIHDSLSVKRPAGARIPSAALLNRVAKAHEKGVAGSVGWRYKFNPEISKRLVLCSQTTAATVRYLASKPKPPVKVFCIDRVYRHEHIDYKHLAEFYQCEGIVMEKDLTLRDMFGYLKLIVNKLGLDKIRFRPGYFPYTEPSVEAEVYFPEKGEWIEILGAGMFRPELLRPLGISYPVLAWGIGFSRLAMVKLGISDIRDLYSCDLAWIRSRRAGTCRP